MLEIEEIKKILPQSYPMLMLDRVLELTEEKIIAIKNISINEAFFQGHFKDKKTSLEQSRKVMPGTLIIEAMAQAAIILFDFKIHSNSRQTISVDSRSNIRENSRQTISVDSRFNIRENSRIYYLGTVRAKFFHPAFPGDQLKTIVTPLKLMQSAGLVQGECFVGDKKIASCELGFSVKTERA